MQAAPSARETALRHNTGSGRNRQCAGDGATLSRDTAAARVSAVVLAPGRRSLGGRAPGQRGERARRAQGAALLQAPV